MTISPADVFAELRASRDLADVSDAVLTRLVEGGCLRQFTAGQRYYTQGDEAREVVFVLSGYLLIGNSDRHGNSHIVRPLTPGMLFNVLPVLDGGPMLHDGWAPVEAEIFVIAKAIFLRIVREEPALNEAVHRLIYQRTRQIYHELAQMALLPLSQRCAQLLTQLMRSADGVSQVSVSQNELAQMLGYSRPMVNRELRTLAHQGVIDITYHRILIRDGDALHRLAEG